MQVAVSSILQIRSRVRKSFLTLLVSLAVPLLIGYEQVRAISLFCSSFYLGESEISDHSPKHLQSNEPRINPHTLPSTGTVYVDFTIDTEPRDPSTTISSQDLNLRDYAPGGLVDQLLQPSFRQQFLDRDGHPIVFSWFLLVQQLQCASTSGDCSAIHAAMAPYRQRAEALGDMYGWHFHHTDWTDLNQDGVSYWNQLKTFNGTQYGSGTDIQDAERVVAQLIFDKGVYPGPFRTGWSWENTDISNWLDDITPFDFSNLSPLYADTGSPPPTKEAAGIEPLFNIFDWSKASTEFTFYHPSSSDYQLPGDLKRYLFRTSDDSNEWNKAFLAAERGQDQLITLVLHSFNPKSLYVEYLTYLQNVAANHPNVKFQYVTALEGAQKMAFGKIPVAAPTATSSESGHIVTITTDEPLFTFPYGALYIDGDYERIRPIDTLADVSVPGRYSWSFDLTRA